MINLNQELNNCFYLNCNNLDLIIAFKKNHSVPIKLISSVLNNNLKDPSPLIILMDMELNQLPIEILLELEGWNNCFFIFFENPNEQSLFLIENIYMWKKLQIISSTKNKFKYLPKSIFKSMPKISSDITYLKTPQDLILLKNIEKTIFSNFPLESENCEIYLSANILIQSVKSICSIKKLMQYFWLRTYRDLA